METLAKIVEKISNFRSKWDNMPLGEKLIKSFIYSVILTLAPVLFVVIVMVFFAVVLYLPGWAYIMALGIILALRRLKKKPKESKGEQNKSLKMSAETDL